MDCSTPGFPVLHYFPEFAQIHVHIVLWGPSNSSQEVQEILEVSVYVHMFLALGSPEGSHDSFRRSQDLCSPPATPVLGPLPFPPLGCPTAAHV